MSRRFEKFIALALSGLLVLQTNGLFVNVPRALADGVLELYASPDGEGDCLTIDTPCDFQTALDLAEADNAVIYLASGTYAGSDFDYNNSGLNISLTIVGAGSDTTMLTTDGWDILTINSGGHVIIHGVAFADEEQDNGAGLYIPSVGILEVYDSRFEGNGSSGLYFEAGNSGASLNIHDNEFINNYSDAGGGAYIYLCHQ